MKKAISAQNTRMFLQNLNAPPLANGKVTGATRSAPCVVTLDNVSALMDGEALLLYGTNWTSLNNQSFVAQNIDSETHAVTLANSDTNDEGNTFDATNARYQVSGYIDVCAVSYQVNQVPAQQVETTSLCSNDKTFKAGKTDPGTLTFDFFIDPTDTDYQELLNAQQDGRERQFIIVYRNGSVRTMPVVVDTVNEAGGVDQAIQGNASLRITGESVLTMPHGEVTPNYVLIATMTPQVGTQPATFTLVINESGGSAESFSIDWGDGAPPTVVTSNVAAHTYTFPGIYRPVVTPTIAGSAGAPSKVQNSVTVEPLAPYSATASIAPATGTAPLFVTLTVSETNGTADTFAVDWGDGSAVETLTKNSAWHTYAKAGTYQASVTPTIYGLVQKTLKPDPVTAGEPVAALTAAVLSDDAHADGIDTNAVMFTATDANGVPVAAALTFSVNSIDASATPASATTDPTTGECAVTVVSMSAQVVTVTADGQGYVHVTASADVTFVPSIPATIQGAGSAAPADGVSQAALTFIVLDATGDALRGIALAFTSDSATAVLSADAGTTDTFGRITVNVSDATAEVVTVTASVGDVSGTAAATFAAMVYASTLTATVQADISPADGISKNAVRFTATDAGGAPLAGAYVLFTLDSEVPTLAPNSALTDANGEVLVQIATVEPGFVTVTGTSGGASATATVEFASTAPVAIIRGTPAPDGVTADGVSYGLVTFTAGDAQANPLFGYTLDITADSATAVIDYPTQTTTDIDGNVTVSVKNTVAELVTLTATRDGATGTATCDFIAAPPNVSAITGTDAPEPVPADGLTPATVTFTVTDSDGGAPAGVTLTATTNSTTALLASATQQTDSNGRAGFVLTDTTGETVTVTATSGDVSGTASAVFTPMNPVGLISVLGTAEVNPVPPDGATPWHVNVTAYNAALTGPAPNALLTLTTSSATALLGMTQGYTDANGFLMVNLTDTVAETVTVTVTAESGVTGSYQYEFR